MRKKSLGKKYRKNIVMVLDNKKYEREKYDVKGVVDDKMRGGSASSSSSTPAPTEVAEAAKQAAEAEAAKQAAEAEAAKQAEVAKQAAASPPPPLSPPPITTTPNVKIKEIINKLSNNIKPINTENIINNLKTFYTKYSDTNIDFYNDKTGFGLGLRGANEKIKNNWKLLIYKYIIGYYHNKEIQKRRLGILSRTSNKNTIDGIILEALRVK